MKTRKDTIRKALLTLVCTAGMGAAVYAQLPPPPTPTTPPTQVPIDGGILLLAAAGAAYGARKVYKNRKDKAE